MNGLVSIIMNCYNSDKYLNEALQSVLHQTYKNWELIFWDNQSNDNSKGIVKSYNDERIRYYYAPKFTILGEARNHALSKANGQYIAFLDCDDIWYPTKLAKQIPCFTDPDVGIVTCDTLFFNQKRVIKQLYKHQKPKTGMAFEYLLSNALSFETVVIRRLALENLDHFFNDKFVLINDYDFIARLGIHCKLEYVDEVLAKWRVHDGSETWDKFSLFPKEKRIFLENIELIVKGFKQKYFKQYILILNRIIFQEAVILWKEKANKSLIRTKIRPFLKSSIRLRGLYFIVHIVPFDFYKTLMKIRNGI